jgi:hypothetical protein
MVDNETILNNARIHIHIEKQITNQSYIYKVGMRYIHSWFLLDLISGIPFAFFDNVKELSSLSVIKILKMGRVAKAVRLVSFLKLTKVIKTTKILSSGHEETLERFNYLCVYVNVYIHVVMCLCFTYVSGLACVLCLFQCMYMHIESKMY